MSSSKSLCAKFSTLSNCIERDWVLCMRMALCECVFVMVQAARYFVIVVAVQHYIRLRILCCTPAEQTTNKRRWSHQQATNTSEKTLMLTNTMLVRWIFFGFVVPLFTQLSLQPEMYTFTRSEFRNENGFEETVWCYWLWICIFLGPALSHCCNGFFLLWQMFQDATHLSARI